MKTHDAKFSVDSGWHKSEKMTLLPDLAAAKNAACTVISILESNCGTPEGLQVLKADGEIKLSRCAGFTLHLSNHRKFARETWNVPYLL